MSFNNYNNPNGQNRSGERRHWVYIMLMVVIVFTLLLMTLGILALRVQNYLPEGTDVVFVVGKNPSVEFGDDTGGWQSGIDVDIFKTSYQNDERVTTVLSKDGTSLIAPGTQMTYNFIAFNNGNVAVFYETDIDFTFLIGTTLQTGYNFPMVVRLKTESSGYLIGSETEWVNVDQAKLTKHISVLGASSYEEFTLELLWQFEGGNDELDTYLGNMSAGQGSRLTLGINTYAEEHINPSAQGGIQVLNEDGENIEHGGTIRTFWLILLFCCVAILIFFIAWLLNKRLRQW